jgi:type I restriction enzyme M protein
MPPVVSTGTEGEATCVRTGGFEVVLMALVVAALVVAAALVDVVELLEVGVERAAGVALGGEPTMPPTVISRTTTARTDQIVRLAAVLRVGRVRSPRRVLDQREARGPAFDGGVTDRWVRVRRCSRTWITPQMADRFGALGRLVHAESRFKIYRPAAARHEVCGVSDYKCRSLATTPAYAAERGREIIVLYRTDGGRVATPAGFENKAAFIWKIADKLRGHLKPHEYGTVMLPTLVLFRLDAVLEPTKAAVLAQAAKLEQAGVGTVAPILKRVSGQSFYNTSPLTMKTMLSDDKNIAAQLRQYIAAFSPGAAEVLEEYHYDATITRLDKAGVLYAMLGDFADIELHPQYVSNEAMGYIFEELLRKFSEMSNETAGEHYTPREVIRLMVDLLFAEDTEALSGPAPVRTVYDPAAGTGGMLTIATNYLAELNPNAHVEVYGQELNPETWAIARSELMMKGGDADRMVLGNSLTADGYAGTHFDYLLANPPYGVDWKAYAEPIKDEAGTKGWGGRFGAGLPRISDGSFLFLQHMISKMKPVADRPETAWIDGGSRIAIVLSGSPLFSGGAGSGESEIRRWIIENDWLEGIVALPDQMFYNTGISTYVWIVTNRKPAGRAGTVTLVDARDMGTKMRKSLGDKRKELTADAIAEISRLFREVPDLVAGPDPDPRVKVMRNEQFGFARLTVERPLRRVWRVDEMALAGLPGETAAALVELAGQSFPTEKDAKIAVSACGLDTKTINAVVKTIAAYDPDAEAIKANSGGGYESDPDLRDQENIPLPAGYLELDDRVQLNAVREAAEKHLIEEIHPYVPDAWIDHDKTKIGYEIPFTRQFYVYSPPRPVAEIRADIDALEMQIQQWMKGLAG